ncbi:MAG: signal recognition particle receptor subunit alpha, partial [Methanomassiliicoccaceae archaeon]|nr:signal recognition particle receptor subunit alpha [Methanomassiliicoccaceae archaeon]
MFDSLKGKFKNIFKKGPAEPAEETPAAEPKVRPEKEKKERPVKKKAPNNVKDDDWDDDWDDDFPNDLIPEDEWVDDPEDEDDDVPVTVPKEVPPQKAPAPMPQPKSAPVPVPVKVDPRPEKVQKVPEPRPAPLKVDPEPDRVNKVPEPKPVPPPVPASVPTVPADDDGKLSRKERAKLAKQEKIAAKQEKKVAKETAKDAAIEKKHIDGELVGDHGKKIKEGSLDEVLWELEVALMEADVALPVVREIMDNVKNDLLGKKYARGHTLDEVVEHSIKDSILKILKLNEFDFDAWFEKRERPVVVMFVGINGTGKTTSIAKVANRLMKNNRTVVLAAADTFRAGAIEQLTIHSERLGCKIVKHAMDADPAAVAFDAIEHAKAKRKDAVLVDTAGRMQTNS